MNTVIEFENRLARFPAIHVTKELILSEEANSEIKLVAEPISTPFIVRFDRSSNFCSNLDWSSGMSLSINWDNSEYRRFEIEYAIKNVKNARNAYTATEFPILSNRYFSDGSMNA